MLGPEAHAGRDALLGHEDVAVLEPRDDALGRARHRVEDRLIDDGRVDERRELGAIEAVSADHLVDESSASRRVGGLRRRAANDRVSADADENSANHVACTSECHAANNFLCPWIDASIPKPAIRVTIEVPPALTSGSGTPTIGSSPDTMPALTNT